MQHSEGFPPVARSDARVLVLGSLPGRQSIAAQQYYAHPRNAFWKIMHDLYGIDGDYSTRCHALINEGVALWDVLHASVRPGSLDADIDVQTAVVNDLRGFVQAHKSLEAIVFNGKKAESLFRKFATIEYPETFSIKSLPSTSPAYAAMSYSGKLELWRAALVPVRQ